MTRAGWTWDELMAAPADVVDDLREMWRAEDDGREILKRRKDG
jgi:hypothetical protein